MGPPQGDVTFSCAEPLAVAATFPGPDSFLQLPGTAAASIAGGISVGFQFRTWNRAGLLLTFSLPQQAGVVWLHLSEARLKVQIHKTGRSLLELSAGQICYYIKYETCSSYKLYTKSSQYRLK